METLTRNEIEAEKIEEHLLHEFYAYKNHTSDELFVDTAIQLIKDSFAGMTCKDEECPHYEEPHSHSEANSTHAQEVEEQEVLRDKWKMVDADCRDSGLITYHVDAFDEGGNLRAPLIAEIAQLQQGRTNRGDSTGGTVKRFGIDGTKLPLEVIPATNGAFVWFSDYENLNSELSATKDKMAMQNVALKKALNEFKYYHGCSEDAHRSVTEALSASSTEVAKYLAEAKESLTIHAEFYCESNGVAGVTSCPVKSHTINDDGSITVRLNFWPPQG